MIWIKFQGKTTNLWHFTAAFMLTDGSSLISDLYTNWSVKLTLSRKFNIANIIFLPKLQKFTFSHIKRNCPPLLKNQFLGETRLFAYNLAIFFYITPVASQRGCVSQLQRKIGTYLPQVHIVWNFFLKI